jgi:endonuclease/exonuclease/phosphatase family metal-dependent hydrolase
MKVVSYNIHYAIGKDNAYDLERVVDAVRGADLIALQEVERHYGPPDGPLQPERIADLLPDYYWVFDAAFDVDGSERGANGLVINRRRQHGQMLLSRWPIVTKRYFPLPRLNPGGVFNMQMGALEALIESPLGKLRIYVVHLGAVSSEERLKQAGFLIELIRQVPAQGGAWTGDADHHVDRSWSAGLDEPIMPEDAILIGDFNMQPDSPEYRCFAEARAAGGNALLTDIWRLHHPEKTVFTWHPNPGRSGDEEAGHLDYCFVTAELVSRIEGCRIDELADGSDHQPLWVEIKTPERRV